MNLDRNSVRQAKHWRDAQRSYGSDQPPSAIAITVFRPDPILLRSLLSAALQTGLPVYVYVDGSDEEALDPETASELHSMAEICLLQGEVNAGIGAALNVLIKRAKEDEISTVCFLDQDSSPDRELPLRLAKEAERLRAAGFRIAAVGPRPVTAANSGTKPPYYHERGKTLGTLRTVDFVITSGALIDVKAFTEIGPFRANFRMDMIDVEWCFRAWAAGYSVWVDEALRLPHRIGTGTIRFGPIIFPQQNMTRMTTYVCAQAFCLRLRHIPVRWKARTILYVPLQIIVYALKSNEPAGTIGGLLRAAGNGLRGRFGDV
jgi:rhamnosyltransferase